MPDLWSTNRLPDFHYDSPPNPALDYAARRRDHLGKRNLARHLRKLAPIKLAREPTPRQLPIRPRTHHRVDAIERYPTQDKWSDRTRQIHAAGQSTSGDRTTIPRHREQIGERGRADRVDAPRPTLFSQRFCGSGELAARDDLA